MPDTSVTQTLEIAGGDIDFRHNRNCLEIEELLNIGFQELIPYYSTGKMD